MSLRWRRLIQQPLQTQLLCLLAMVVTVAIVLTALAFAMSTRSSNAERVSRALHAQVIAADALLALPDRGAAIARLNALEIRFQQQLPPEIRPTLPLLLRIEPMMHARLPGRSLQLSGEPAELWIQSQNGQGWIGIPVLGAGEPFKRGVLLSIAAIGVLVLFAAALFARTLTRPLHSLAKAASGIVAGDAPVIERFASAEIVALQRALATAAEQTRTAARDRELMLAGLSHDMRTPLARLRYSLALLEGDAVQNVELDVEPDIEPRGAMHLDVESCKAMDRDIDELDTIIGQFIDYVRDGRDESESEVDLAALLRELTEQQVRMGRDWTLHVPEVAILRGRPLALQRALNNLLDNAAKHGAAPFEAVLEVVPSERSDRKSDRKSNRGWRVRVLDRGPGVPEHQLSELGRPFHRIDTARSSPGSGLGLASAARVAAIHHGSLVLRNRDGGGLEVELRLL